MFVEHVIGLKENAKKFDMFSNFVTLLAVKVCTNRPANGSMERMEIICGRNC